MSVYLHDVEQTLLAESVLLPEEVVLGVGACDVAADDFLTGRVLLQVLRVLVLGRRLMCIAQQLPDHAAEVVRYSLPHEVLSTSIYAFTRRVNQRCLGEKAVKALKLLNTAIFQVLLWV